MATPTPLNLVQGETYYMSLTWETDGTPNSLVGHEAHMQIRKRVGAPGLPLIDMRSTGLNPDITMEPAAATGVISIRVPASETEKLVKTEYFYDLFIVLRDDPDERQRLLYGPAHVSDSVTMPVDVLDTDGGDPGTVDPDILDGGGP